MNEQEVQKQIRQMISFIDQEAQEKATEIDAKAEEEFNIEKSRLVQQQRLKIMDFYEKKEKQIELQKKIQQSNLQNQSRIAILKAREDLVQQLKDDAIKSLALLANDEKKYTDLLINLIAQGLFQLIEPEVKIRCREKDVKLVTNAIQSACQLYKGRLHRDVKVVLSEQYLPPQIAGGVEIITSNNKIRVVNTLEARLDMLFRQMIPEIREKLFGKNQSRKYND